MFYLWFAKKCIFDIHDPLGLVRCFSRLKMLKKSTWHFYWSPKCFDTVDHVILLNKLAHYRIRGSVNDWFKSYLYDRQQFLPIIGYDSTKLTWSSTGLRIRSSRIFIYINDLHKSIKYCNARHFVDDTNLLISNNLPKQLQQYLYRD